MNQGKLKVVKQDMARVNIDVLGISELKYAGMGKFNSHDQAWIKLNTFDTAGGFFTTEPPRKPSPHDILGF